MKKQINKLTIHAILCRNVTIFYLQELGSLFQLQKKLKVCTGIQNRTFRLAVSLQMAAM